MNTKDERGNKDVKRFAHIVSRITPTDCQYCHKEIKKEADFILVGKYPSTKEKWREKVSLFNFPFLSPETFGTIYHKSCFLEMTNIELSKKVI
jgi:hypothetical protein